MKPKLIALNLLLLIALGGAVWQMRAKWQQTQATRQANLNVPIRPIPPPPLAPAPKPDAPAPAKYLDVAEKDLFSKDRNPTVIVEAPKVEPPKPMPSLPVVYGVMGLPSGTKAIMAEKSGGSTRPVRAGDTIGEFRIAKLDTRDVVFEWNGKEVPKKIEDLVDRSVVQAVAAGQSSAPSGPAVAAPAAPAAQQPQPVNNNPTAKDLGVELTQAQRACKPNWQTDGIPAGTVVDGFKKVVTASPFGSTCRWTKQ